MAGLIAGLAMASRTALGFGQGLIRLARRYRHAQAEARASWVNLTRDRRHRLSRLE